MSEGERGEGGREEGVKQLIEIKVALTGRFTTDEIHTIT